MLVSGSWFAGEAPKVGAVVEGVLGVRERVRLGYSQLEVAVEATVGVD